MQRCPRMTTSPAPLPNTLPDAVPAATKTWPNPKGGFLVFVGIASIGAAMAELVPLVLTVAIKAQGIDPRHASTLLSIAIAVGALLSLIAYPLFGRLSDRTLSRLGRRRPFLILGAILIALGAVVLLIASSLPLLILGTALTLVGFSAATVAITSLIPDQLSPDRRGGASAVVGLSLPLGAVIGLFIAQLVSGSLAAMILLPAGVAVVGILLLAVRLSDRRLSREERPTFTLVAFFSTFWVNPGKNPNYAWAWFSRLLLFFGVASVNAYQFFYLAAVLHLAPAAIAGGVFLSTLTLTIAALIFAPIAAKLSDRVGRRKPFVIFSSIVYGIGLVMASVAHSFPVFLAAMAVMGIGQGVYMAVDLALVTQILPDPDNAGKDLGVMNLANSLPQSLVPALAPAILLIGATAAFPQNYPALFITGAIAAIVGGLLIIPIRRVR
jgi:MFS family permease